MFPIASAPEPRVKYCFCVVLHAVWEICWLSLALYWMAADRFALGESVVRKVCHTVAKAENRLSAACVHVSQFSIFSLG